MTIDAFDQLRRMPAFRNRVEHHLLEILQAAEDIEKLSGEAVASDARLITRLGAYEIGYSLDMHRECVTVLDVDELV
jgi:hypothetical protein